MRTTSIRQSETDPKPDLDIFVPAIGTVARRVIAPGSAIVGKATGQDVLVDYEGGIYRMNRFDFESFLQSAAGRHTVRYPTVARMLLPVGHLIKVGVASYLPILHAWLISDITVPDALQAWFDESPTHADLPTVGGSMEMKQRAAGRLFARMRPDVMVRIMAAVRNGGDMTTLILDEAAKTL